MPETITRPERLAAIRSLLPPRKVIDGRPQPYNSKIYNTVLDLLEMVEEDMQKLALLTGGGNVNTLQVVRENPPT